MAKANWNQVFAVAKKVNSAGVLAGMKNERYQRTPTDEYPFRKKSRGRFKPVDPEQKASWAKLAERKW